MHLQEETYIDPESLEELPLAPHMSKTETILRWGFIRKVYGIIAAQLVLTSVVVSVILFSPPVQNFSRNNVAFQVCFFLGPLVGESPSSGAPHTVFWSPSRRCGAVCRCTSTLIPVCEGMSVRSLYIHVSLHWCNCASARADCLSVCIFPLQLYALSCPFLPHFLFPASHLECFCTFSSSLHHSLTAS